MSDMFSRPYHYGHPQIGTAIEGTGQLLSELHKLPDSVIAEAMLQEIVWMIDSIDVTSPEATAMRGVISWFSDQCAELVVPPSTARLDWH